jgi:hypothetical protein
MQQQPAQDGDVMAAIDELVERMRANETPAVARAISQGLKQRLADLAESESEFGDGPGVVSRDDFREALEIGQRLAGMIDVYEDAIHGLLLQRSQALEVSTLTLRHLLEERARNRPVGSSTAPVSPRPKATINTQPDKRDVLNPPDD